MSPEKYPPNSIKISKINLSEPMAIFHNVKEQNDSDTEYEKDMWIKYISSRQDSLNSSYSDQSKTINSFSIDFKDLEVPINHIEVLVNSKVIFSPFRNRSALMSITSMLLGDHKHMVVSME